MKHAPRIAPPAAVTTSASPRKIATNARSIAVSAAETATAMLNSEKIARIAPQTAVNAHLNAVTEHARRTKRANPALKTADNAAVTPSARTTSKIAQTAQ